MVISTRSTSCRRHSRRSNSCSCSASGSSPPIPSAIIHSNTVKSSRDEGDAASTFLDLDDDFDEEEVPDDPEASPPSPGEEAGEKTNQMAGRSEGDGTEVFPLVVINSVVHETRRVLQYEELDSN